MLAHLQKNRVIYSKFHLKFIGLAFIETSALDSTNVDLAFQKILTGLFGNFIVLDRNLPIIGKINKV